MDIAWVCLDGPLMSMCNHVQLTVLVPVLRCMEEEEVRHTCSNRMVSCHQASGACFVMGSMVDGPPV